MQFRKAYFDSIDAHLAELSRQLDEMADVARSFAHLSAGVLPLKGKAKVRVAKRPRPPAWPTDSGVPPSAVAIAGQ